MSTRLVLVDLQSSSPHLRLPEADALQLQARAPHGWRVSVVNSTAVTAANGTSRASDETLTAASEAEVYVGYGVTPPVLAAAPRLQWAHSASAGIGGSITPELRERVLRGLLFTNSAGAYGEVMAETVLAGVLHFTRSIDVAVRQQAAREWNQSVIAHGDMSARELSEHRVLVIGAGGIGSCVARLFTALGCECTGIRRRPELGPPDGFSRVAGPEAVERELSQAEIVVIAAPDTRDTTSLLNRARLALLPRGAIVVNVARGALIDEVALVEALEHGMLRGAVLDVFQTEPLPMDHPLWRHPKVLVIPHVSGVSPRRQWARVLGVFEDNWRRYAAGEPLRNIVDLSAGY